MQFTEEQALLLDTASKFCREQFPMSRVREDIANVATHDAALWQQMVDMGWLSVAVPQALDGLGLGLAGAVPIVESMGRQLASSPYLATTLAIHTLVTNGNEAQQQQWLTELQSGAVGTLALLEEDGSWLLEEPQLSGTVSAGQVVLQGVKCQVLDAAEAEVMIVSASIAHQARLVLVSKSQLPPEQIRREVVIDETRRSYTIDFSGVQVDEAQILPGEDFAAIEHAALLLLSAEISGGLSGVLATIVEYLNTRKQFDRLIGSYQALKHPAVDILLAEEAAKSHLYHAASVMAEGDAQATEVAVRMAKAHGSESFAHAGDRAVQFHGGFGFTYDCDAQLFLRRALWCQHQFGDERYHRQLLAPLLLDTA